VLVNAEVCSPYDEILERVLPGNVLISGYSDQVFGYLPSDNQIELGGYEVSGFFEPFGLEGSYKPRIEEYVAETVREALIPHGD